MRLGTLPASLANARAYADNPIAFYRSLSGAGGGFGAVVRFEFFGPHVLINDPELVAAVLSSPSGGGFNKDGLRFFAVVRRVTGDGLFSIDGPRHLERRRRVEPGLRWGVLRRTAGTGAMSRMAERMRAELVASTGQVVDVADVAGRAVLDLLAEALAGPALAEPVRELGRLFEQAEPHLLRVLQAPVVFPGWVPTPNNRRLARAAAAFRDRAAELLRTGGYPPDSLLGRLQDRGVEPRHLLDELVTFVVGGHQSTAAAVGFALYLLAAYPDEAELVAREADQVLRGRAATADDLPALPRTGMVVAESLRLYPPVWIIMRRMAGSRELPGWRLSPGTTVHISPHTLHRNPRYWPEPDAFRPDRFADPGAGHRFAYAPFGGGPHKCVGNHFALMATAIVIATVAQAVRLGPPAAAPVVSARSFTVPVGGIPLPVGRR